MWAEIGPGRHRTPHGDGKYSQRTPTLHAKRGRGQRAAALGPANGMHRRPLLLLPAASRWTPPHQEGEGKAGQAGGLLAHPASSCGTPDFPLPLGGTIRRPQSFPVLIQIRLPVRCKHFLCEPVFGRAARWTPPAPVTRSCIQFLEPLPGVSTARTQISQVLPPPPARRRGAVTTERKRRRGRTSPVLFLSPPRFLLFATSTQPHLTPAISLPSPGMQWKKMEI